MSVPGLVRMLLVVLAAPAVLLGAVAGAALALACTPVLLLGLSIRSVARIGRPAHQA